MAILVLGTAAFAAGDWAAFGRYAEANKNVKQAPMLVIMGDSITDFWPNKTPPTSSIKTILSDAE